VKESNKRGNVRIT